MTYFNVRDFGAVGDGVSIDSPAIQKAIDECFDHGGGTVYLPAGIYACGTLFLRNNIELNLDSGAIIKADPRAEFNAPDCFSENAACISKNEMVDGRHLLIAYECENVALTGRGTIDGNYVPFHDAGINKNGKALPKVSRPAQMVFFCASKDIKIRDVKFINSSYWSLFIYGCEKILIDGIYAYTAPELWCGDGIDIDSSRDVIINNCNVESEDDALTLRCNNRFLKEPMNCENILVANCFLSSLCAYCIRVGVGDGIIRNASFSNIIVKKKSHKLGGIALHARYSPVKTGVGIENISFSNFNMDVDLPLFISCGYKNPQALRNVSFSNMRINATAGMYIGGTADNMSENISFDNTHIKINPGRKNIVSRTDMMKIWEGASDSYSMVSEQAPYCLWIDNVIGCRFTNSSLTLNDYDNIWLEKIKINNSNDIELDGLKCNWEK
jgi:polygalacturonase